MTLLSCLFAAAIGVTSQAVSKWEREEGYPDITLLPSIAGFFGVTVDTVCGLDAEREKDEIEKIVNEAWKNPGKEAVKIFRKGLETVILQLAAIYFMISPLNHGMTISVKHRNFRKF